MRRVWGEYFARTPAHQHGFPAAVKALYVMKPCLVHTRARELARVTKIPA
jgi:hypothetical protein